MASMASDGFYGGTSMVAPMASMVADGSAGGFDGLDRGGGELD